MTITTIRFTACGDIHNNLINLDKIKAFILDMKNQGKVDFAGFVGDYVSSSADITQLNNVKDRFDALAAAGIKYYAATGNHDASGSNCYNNCSGTAPTHATDCVYKTAFGYFPDQYPQVTDFTKGGVTFQILIPGMCWTGGAFWKYDFANSNINKTAPTIVFNHGPVLKPAGVTCGAWDSLHEYAFSMKSQLDALNMLSIYSGHIHAAGYQVINNRLYVVQDSINSSRCSGTDDKHRNIGYTKITYDSSTNQATIQYQNIEYMNASNVVNAFVDPFPDGGQQLTSIEISPTSASINVNGTTQLSAVCKDQNGTIMTCPTLTWTNSNSAIATVSSSGLVTGVAEGGPVNITAKSGSITSNVSAITVTTIPSVLTSIVVSPTSASIGINGTKQLTAICKDQNGAIMTCPTLTWHSSDTTKVTVNSSGLVTGIAPGTANITVKSGSVTSNVSAITVTMPLLTSIVISPASASITVNGTTQLSAVCKDQNGAVIACPTITWHTSNATKATVNPTTGIKTTVTGVAIGTVNITATAGPVTSNISVITVETVSESITVTTPSTGLIYKVGESRVVRWTHTSGTGTSVKIELLKAGIVVKTISSSTANDDAFAWTVPSVISGTDYQIKVTSMTNTKIFGTSGKFTISGTTPPQKYKCSGTPDFQCVEDPNGPYTTLAECQTACHAPVMKYKCSGTPDFQCVEDPNGPYTTLAECQTACKPIPATHNLGVFYYPWFGGNSNVSSVDTWRHWKNGGHNPPKTWASNYLPNCKLGSFDPNIELYSSKDLRVIKWQLGMMNRAGIEFVISSWWGQNSYEDQALDIMFNQVLPATDNPYPDVKFCIYYEKEGIKDVPKDEIIADINYIKQKYVSNPHYFKINGKPVIFVYNALGGTNIASKWKYIRDLTGIYTVLKVFSGYNNVVSYADSWHQYSPSLAFEQQWNYSAFVSPGYHKYHEQPRLIREAFVRFENNVKTLASAKVQFRLIETWNEWEEATGIEPAHKIKHDDVNGFTPAADSYGTKYIDILAKYFKQ